MLTGHRGETDSASKVYESSTKEDVLLLDHGVDQDFSDGKRAFLVIGEGKQWYG